MEHETLFTTSKWAILKQLESQPRSPLELARLSNTSVANVSQQLRLLEMAGLVTSVRVSNRDKDKPRILYSLAGNLSYLIATTGSFVDKKLLNLSDYNKIIMRIWFFERTEFHYVLEKAFWKIEEHLDKMTFLAFNKQKFSPIVFYYASSGKPLQIKPFTVADRDGVVHQIIFDQNIPAVEQIHILHDPKGLALDTTKTQSEEKGKQKKRGGVQ